MLVANPASHPTTPALSVLAKWRYQAPIPTLWSTIPHCELQRHVSAADSGFWPVFAKVGPVTSTSLSVHRQAIHSTVVKKGVMAITGLVLIGFLLVHMFGNLKIFIGPTEYNHYAGWLKEDLLYPLLPSGWFIWLFRAFLLVCLILHVYCMAVLWSARLHGRGAAAQRRYVRTKRKEQTWSSAIMRWGGMTLALLLLFHLLMFTTGTITPGFEYALHDPYTMFVGAFSSWWVFAVYAVFVILVCMHIRHGFWSAFTTLGANVGPNARIVLNALAYFVAALLFVGFILPPLAVLTGMVV